VEGSRHNVNAVVGTSSLGVFQWNSHS